MSNSSSVPKSALDLGIIPQASFLPAQIKYTPLTSIGAPPPRPRLLLLSWRISLFTVFEPWSLSVTKWPWSVAPNGEPPTAGQAGRHMHAGTDGLMRDRPTTVKKGLTVSGAKPWATRRVRSH